MVRRVWSNLCCSQKWILLISPLLLLSFTIFMMAITLPLPLPPSSMDRRSSRALSSAEDFVRPGPGPGVAEPPRAVMDAFLDPPLLHVHSGAWRSSVGGEKPKYPLQPKPFGDRGSDEKNSFKGRSRTNRHKRKSKAVTAKRNGPIQSTSRHQPGFPELRVSSAELKRGIRSSNHSAGVKLAVQTYVHAERSKSTAAPAKPDTVISERGAGDRQAAARGREHINRSTDGQIQASTKLQGLHQALGKHRQAKRHAVSFDKMAKVAKKSSVDVNKPRAESPSSQKEDGSWCPNFREQDFPDSDRRRIRTNGDRPPWFSSDDVQKMELLASGEVISKANVPAHGQVLQVGLDPPADQQDLSHMAGSPGHRAAGRQSSIHGHSCRTGPCCLVKRTDDWFEVFAFHLDRVLGLNRSLPAVLRTFHSDILPYRYTGGTPRPAVWWDPGIQHLADGNNDQNSVALSWIQYQQLLQAHCGRETQLNSDPCVGVRHSEWGRLALFDFLLQVNDRLDRYCCGFTPDPSELCVENLLHAKCGNTKDLLLVHILVRKADPSRLVFIDNAGRPQQSINNLNFKLIEGIDEFPERAVSVLGSGCLESLLLRSLYTDRELWESRGGAAGLRPLVRTVQHRGDVLLKRIKDKKLLLRSDL